MSGGSSSLYAMSYFELEPQYQCQSDTDIWTECTKEDFCDTEEEVEFEVNWDSIYSLRNWIEELIHNKPRHTKEIIHMK